MTSAIIKMNSYITSALLVLCIFVTDIHSHEEKPPTDIHSHGRRSLTDIHSLEKKSDHPRSATASRHLDEPAAAEELASRSFMPFMQPALPNPLDNNLMLWSYEAAEPLRALFNYEGPSKVNLPYRIERFNSGYQSGYIIYNYAVNKYYPQQINMCTAYVYDAPHEVYYAPYSQTVQNYCEPYYSAPAVGPYY